MEFYKGASLRDQVGTLDAYRKVDVVRSMLAYTHFIVQHTCCQACAGYQHPLRLVDKQTISYQLGKQASDCICSLACFAMLASWAARKSSCIRVQAFQMAQALYCCHHQGVVHGGVNKTNVIICSSSESQVLHLCCMILTYVVGSNVDQGIHARLAHCSASTKHLS